MLSKKQRDFIKASLDNPLLTDKDVAEMVGVTTVMVSKWRNLPQFEEFREEYNRALHQQWEGYAKEAQAVLYNILLTGNHQNSLAAAKYVLDSTGYKPTDKVDITADASVNVSVSYGDDDE